MENSEDPNSILESHRKLIFSAVKNAAQNPNTILRLRQKVRQLRKDLEHGRQVGEDLGQLYPADIWKLIFDLLEDVNDLTSCTQACTSFNHIINCSKQQLLFGKILPHVIPHLTENIFEDKGIWDALANCALVCQKWHTTLKGFGYPKNGFLGQPPIGYITGRDYHIYTFQNEPDYDYDGGHREFKNPFLRAISIEIAGGRTSLPCLDKFGSEVWKLDFKFLKDELYSSSQIYLLCIKGIQKCGQLKTLCLEDKNDEFTIVDNHLDESLTPVSTAVESLSVQIENHNILPVQNKLLKCLSAQLKQVKVRYWNPELCQNLTWTSLTELEILEQRSIDVLSFLEISAPENLQNLSICLDSSCQNLTRLFQALQKFPKLKHLSLSVKDGFTAWTENDIVEVPLELLNTKYVKSLTISARKLQSARDLALFFPFVKNLLFIYGDPNPGNNQSNGAIRNLSHFIQLPKDMYKSNIWEVLPFLEYLKLEDRSFYKTEYRRFWYKEKKVKEFTRADYTVGREDYLRALQQQVTWVREIVQDQTKKRLTREREILNEAKTDANIVYMHPDIFVQINTEAPLHVQVFPFVINLLEYSEIMNCRMVCKFWKEIVGDKILENCKHNIFYRFQLPYAKRSQFRKLVQENQLNPFFARKVEFCLKNASGNTFGIQPILDTIGKHIHVLKISAEENSAPNMWDVYRILMECMRQCVNLRSLFFEIREIGSTLRTYQLYEKTKALDALSAPPRLEFISSCGLDYVVDDRVQDTSLNTILKDIIHATRNTVKVLKQDRCVGGYIQNLRELTVTFSEKSEIINFYQASQLETLSLYLFQQNIPLGCLCRLKRDYPNLKSLELNFHSSFGGFEYNVRKFPSDCFLEVTELKIVLQDKSHVSLDFLVQFPIVRKLCIVYGKYSLSFNENLKNLKGINDAEYDVPKVHPEEDFIQLMHYFKDEKINEHEMQSIYASNLWSVLSKLQKLEVVYCEKEEVQERAFFNRVEADILHSKL